MEWVENRREGAEGRKPRAPGTEAARRTVRRRELHPGNTAPPTPRTPSRPPEAAHRMPLIAKRGANICPTLFGREDTSTDFVYPLYQILHTRRAQPQAHSSVLASHCFSSQASPRAGGKACAQRAGRPGCPDL